MRRCLLALIALFFLPLAASAEVIKVTIASRTAVAEGKVFGASGPYEKLVGRIEFALDPRDPHNKVIVDLDYAPRDADGRVHFSSDLVVMRPTDPAKGNGVLLFDIANRGRASGLSGFNRARLTSDPKGSLDVGDGLLMREGYTVVIVGWEGDIPAPALRVDAPPANLPPETRTDLLAVEIMVNERSSEAYLIDDPAGRPPVNYPPASASNPSDRLTVRDHFWDAGVEIARQRWRFVAAPNGTPKVQLDGGFEPGRYYRVTYDVGAAHVAGVGLAAIRDAASAFRYRSDLPVHGRSAYSVGQSQAGRFQRQFLYDGFNVDERGRRVFDGMLIQIAGAGRGGFNERFAIPTHGAMFTATRFPFTDLDETDVDGNRDGLLSRYKPAQRPKIIYANTGVEYWGGGRAAALTHTAADGGHDLTLPPNVRVYFLAGPQHIEAAFPPQRTPPVAGATVSPGDRSGGQQLNNPIPQTNVMRALLRTLHLWAASGVAPPASEHPRLDNGTLVAAEAVRFPRLPGVADPRRIAGPARMVGGKVSPLPHLVPQVDGDGNDLGGIRDPDAAVPLATTTGWNFRGAAIGNPDDIYPLLGSYIPFARTQAGRGQAGDPRLSIEERYRDRADYLDRVRAAAIDLVKRRFLLEEDVDVVMARAAAHWAFATAQPPAPAAP